MKLRWHRFMAGIYRDKTGVYEVAYLDFPKPNHASNGWYVFVDGKSHSSRQKTYREAKAIAEKIAFARWREAWCRYYGKTRLEIVGVH